MKNDKAIQWQNGWRHTKGEVPGGYRLLDITITREEFNMDTEMLTQILKINLNVEKVYVKTVPKDEWRSTAGKKAGWFFSCGENWKRCKFLKQYGHTMKLGFFSIYQKQSINLCNGKPLHLQAQRQLKRQNQKIKTNEPCLLKSCMLCCSNPVLNIILVSFLSSFFPQVSWRESTKDLQARLCLQKKNSLVLFVLKLCLVGSSLPGAHKLKQFTGLMMACGWVGCSDWTME